ncbi:MAG: PleD family two-component system response regulator [Actinomycetota bacterium]
MARVLIVDDDRDAVPLFRRWLERLGHQVCASSTGEGALRALADSPFDLVLLDVFLPGISGYEVAKRMAEDERLRTIPVVMISIAEREDLPESPNVREWLLKPFRASDLRATVARHAGEAGGSE